MAKSQYLRQLLGKTIADIMYKEDMLWGTPFAQLYILFDDDTHFEFYADAHMSPTKGLWQNGDLEPIFRSGPTRWPIYYAFQSKEYESRALESSIAGRIAEQALFCDMTERDVAITIKNALRCAHGAAVNIRSSYRKALQAEADRKRSLPPLEDVEDALLNGDEP